MKDQIEENVIKKNGNNLVYRYIVLKSRPEDETIYTKSYSISFAYEKD